VILGQDPYHNVNQAHGLCFSVRPPTTPPPSLKNIFKCLAIDYPSFRPPPNNSGLLTPWADRGVLLLNTCLTVRAHEANSHADKGWEQLTQRVIDIVAAKRTRGVVFLAWGAPAGKRVAKINQKIHCVLKSVHPSPLSASRGWFECGHFKKTNEWLVKAYGPGSEIDWDLGEKRLVEEEEDEGKEVENIEKNAEDKVEGKDVEPNGGKKVEDKLEEKVQEKDEGEDKENKEN
jgi:uracil-DNA glycosylase